MDFCNSNFLHSNTVSLFFIHSKGCRSSVEDPEGGGGARGAIVPSPPQTRKTETDFYKISQK